jgi:hypothetical protein
MVYNNTELDAAEGITEYKEAPSWMDVMSAKVDSVKAVGLSTSEHSHFEDQLEKNVKVWENETPQNKPIFDQLRNASYQNLDRMEEYYKAGETDKIKSFYALPGQESVLGSAFLQFKELGLKDIPEIRQDARDQSLAELEEANKILINSESTSAEVIGGIYGILHDPVILGTLPLGTFKTGGTLAFNAFRAAVEEMGIESLIQTVAAPQIYSYKKELGMNVSILDEALNAATAIGGAGLIRGTGSATWDLTASGVSKLKAKDPQLGAEYETLAKSNISDSMNDHVANLDSVEFGNASIQNLNHFGKKIEAELDIPEVATETFVKAKDVSKTEQPLMVNDGTDVDGNTVYRSYEDLELDLDAEEELLNKTFNKQEETVVIEDTKVFPKESTPEEIIAMEESIPKEQGFQQQNMIVNNHPINKTDFDLIKKYQKTREFNLKNPDKKRPISKIQEEAYIRNVGIADDLKDMEFKSDYSGVMFGAAAALGISEQEKGN